VALLQSGVLACWVVFLAFWAINAFATKRTVQAQPLAARLTHSIPVFVGAWLLLKGSTDPSPLEDRVLPHSAAVAAVGFAVTALGLSLAIWARATLGRNWSGRVTFKDGHELIRHGPYRYVRHPIYSAILTMFLGSAIAIGRLGGLIGLPLVLLGVWLKLTQEEALMSEHFPAEYASYRSQVKALVPGLL
jgi:protein-S-isoprenylcysteine O-methyltransferase Ste14